MGFSLNGRYLGDTPSEALANMTRKEISDLAYWYIVQYFSVEDVAETIANNRESSVDWADDALNSLADCGDADCPGEIAGLTYSGETEPTGSECVRRTRTSKTTRTTRTTGKKKPAAGKSPTKKATSGRRRP